MEESIFLFGPRQTGKSTWLKSVLPDALTIDLLQPKVLRELSRNPELFEDQIRHFVNLKKEQRFYVVVDEVQRIPDLIDVVQSILVNGISKKIDNLGGKADLKKLEFIFVLTGSSPRRLLKVGKNLLGGRAGWKTFHPLMISELLSDPEFEFSAAEMVQWGGMPALLRSKSKRTWFENYIEVFLETEIRNEALVRNLAQFERFLKIAASLVSEQLVYRAVASDLGVSEKTVTAWFQILVDTLLGELLPCFSLTVKRKPVQSPKFFLFDCGVANAILGRHEISEGTREYASAMESWVYQNLKALCGYSPRKYKLFYWRSTDKAEVDFIVALNDLPIWAIEVKSTTIPKPSHFDGLLKFREDFPEVNLALVCNVHQPSLRQDGIFVSDFVTLFRKLEGMMMN